MAPKDSEHALRAWRALLIAQAVALDGVEASLQRGEQMPLTWFEVLARLSREEGGMLRMQDLAERLVLSRSGATRLVDRLEAAGLIERASCTDDRRGTLAVATAAGLRALEETRPFVNAAVEEQFGRLLEPSEAQLLESLLTKVLDGHGYGPERASDCGAPAGASQVVAVER